MSKDLKDFYEYLAGNVELMESVQENLKKIFTKEELNKYIESEIMPLAKEKKFNFSQEDLMKYEEKSLKRLAEEDLLNVAGGFSPKSSILAGGIFSLVLLGAGAYGNSTAHAAVPKDVILNSTEQLRSQNVQDEPVNKPKTSPTEALKENVTSNEDLGKKTEENAVLESNSSPKTLGDTASESLLHENTSNKELSKNDILKSTNELIDNSKIEETASTDNEYIAEALNLIEPYVYNFSGTTGRFRLFDGNKQEIHVGEVGGDGIPTWDCKRDVGEGSTNFMSCLFPSSGGTLNSEGGAPDVPSFSKNCNPTPEDIAKVAGYIHNYIRCEDARKASEAKKELDSLVNGWSKYEFDKKISTWLIERLSKTNNINNLSDLEKYISESKQINLSKQQKGNFTVLLNRLNTSKFYTYSNPNNFLSKYKESFGDMMDTNRKITKFFKKYLNTSVDFENNSDNELYTNLYLLQNAELMINQQEIKDERNTEERILPKYTTERMLMSYFINHFNTNEEVKRFYDEAKKIIKTPNSKILLIKELNKKTDRLDNIKKILKKILSPDNCPYKDTLVSNAVAKIIKITKDNKLKFSEVTFADCADTAARHIINLLSYDDANKWQFILGNPSQEEIKTLEQGVAEICQAIKDNSTVENKPLKERVKLFFYYQSQKGADVATLEARSFWNYVISNMDKDSPDYAYKIRYSTKNNGNELDTGWLNCLKLTYNIVDALKGEDTNFTQKLKDAKQKIDFLETEFKSNKNSKKLEDYLEDAIGSTFRTINNIGANIYSIELTNFDIYGDIKISKNYDSNTGNCDFIFDTVQVGGHAEIEFNPNTTLKFKVNEFTLRKFMEADKTAQLLSNIFHIDTESVSNFNILFGKLKTSNSITSLSPKYICNYNILTFLKNAQGEGENVERLDSLLNGNGKSADIKVVDKAGQSKDASHFVFDNYLKTPGLIYKFLGIDKISQRSQLYDVAKSIFPSRIVTADDGSEFLCRIKNDNTVGVYLLKTKENGKTFNVPAKIMIENNSYNVSEIMGACSSEIENIEVQDSVTSLSIGESAFKECKNLKKIKIPNSVTSLKFGNEAFSGTNIEVFTVPESIDSLEIGKWVFELCDNLKEFNIPESVTSLKIDRGAFSRANIERFTVPESVTSLEISKFAFKGCKNLKEFNIPKSVTSLKIDREAFDSSSLKKFTVPESVKFLEIGQGAFDSSNLEKFTVPKSLTHLEIGKKAFANSNLEKFTAPKSLTHLKIDEEAFAESSLKNFTVPESVTHLEIGYGAFKGCKNLKEFKIQKSVTSLKIGERAFAWSSLKNFTVPESVTHLEIGEGAFRECKNLKEFNILGPVTSLKIGKNIFKTWLAKFTVPTDVAFLTIGYEAFCGCKNLKEFNISNSVKSLEIGERAFAWSSLKNFTVPESVISLKIGNRAFESCKNLEKFTVPKSVKFLKISNNLFNGCEKGLSISYK